MDLQVFIPEDWAYFVAHAGTLLIRPGALSGAELVRTWMKNQSLMRCSNLVWFSADQPTLLLLASPFPDRPCGRPLPDIAASCHCVDSHAPPRRKAWMVRHNCQDGMEVKDARVTVECSSCKRQWQLPTIHMEGVFWEVDGLFAVVAPYF
jgi:hypothetical protein